MASIRDSLRGTFGLAQAEFPTFKYRGATWHFRVQTPGDERWAVAQSALMSLVAAEASMINDALVTLVCIVKQEFNGETSYPWMEFVDRETINEKQRPLLEQAAETPEAPPVEIARAAALNFLKYLDEQPSGVLDEMIEFYAENIKPLGDALSMTRYLCQDCMSRPDYVPPIRETLPEPPFCEYCGERTQVHAVLREAVGANKAPLA